MTKQASSQLGEFITSTIALPARLQAPGGPPRRGARHGNWAREEQTQAYRPRPLCLSFSLQGQQFGRNTNIRRGTKPSQTGRRLFLLCTIRNLCALEASHHTALLCAASQAQALAAPARVNVIRGGPLKRARLALSLSLSLFFFLFRGRRRER